MRKKISSILADYGPVAVVVYFAIFFLVLGAFAAAIQFGWRPAGVGGRAGVWAAAYVATKLTQPLRIAATVALTPLCARLYERLRPRPHP